MCAPCRIGMRIRLLTYVDIFRIQHPDTFVHSFAIG